MDNEITTQLTVATNALNQARELILAKFTEALRAIDALPGRPQLTGHKPRHRSSGLAQQPAGAGPAEVSADGSARLL